MLVGIVLIAAEEPLMGYILKHIGDEHFLLSLSAKIIILLSLKPIDKAIESYMLRRLVLKKRKHLSEKSHKNMMDNQSVTVNAEHN